MKELKLSSGWKYLAQTLIAFNCIEKQRKQGAHDTASGKDALGPCIDGK
jgi:hypothetical protein